MIRALLLLCLFAVPCFGQTRTGNASTTGPCSPAISGNNNSVTLENCSPIAPKEAAQLGTKIAVILASATTGSSGPPQHKILTTGFWISSAGFALTCLEPIAQISPSELVAGVPFSPFFGNLITVAGGIMYTPAQIAFRDSNTNLAIVRIYNSPFERALHMVATAQNVETGETEGRVEQYTVPKLGSQIPDIGDEVVLVGKQGEAGEGIPVMGAEFGHVMRLGIDGSSHNGSRIYTSIPFSEDYCGAPVLDTASREVVGIAVNSDSEDHTMVISAKDIGKLLTDAKLASN